MKKYILILTLVAAVNAQAANEDWKNCDDEGTSNCEYQIKDGVLTIRPQDNSQPASIPDYARDCSNTRYSECTTTAPWKWEENTNTITTLKIESGITSVGYDAFENMETVANLIIPDTVTNISNNAFMDMWQLKNVTIPDSVTTIGERAFQWAHILEKLVIPDSVTSIGDYAFDTVGLQLAEPGSTTIYCATTSPCAGKGHENIIAYDKQSGVYILEGQIYASPTDMINTQNACVDMDTCKAKVLKNKGYCSSDEACAAMVETENANHPIEYKNKSYASIDDLLKGKYMPKRIYTIDEANEVAGKTNTFTIRYR